MSGVRIAIVGLGGIFPGAPDLAKFWQNVAAGVDAGRAVAAERWALRPERCIDRRGVRPDRAYSDWCCLIDELPRDFSGLTIDPGLLARLDPLFHLGLYAAANAWRSARLEGLDRARIGVILGNIALPTESTSGMARDALGRTVLEVNGRAVPPRTNWHAWNRYAAGLPAVLIAEALGLGGVAFTLDAACASSLYAIKFAVDELQAGRADAMLAGGMSRPDCQYTQMGFAQLQALSKRGRCAPLSAAADGLVVGEGAGVFVLKRLDDAVAAGDRIHGVIAGVGLSNDRGGNLLAPTSEGQLRAMRSAYAQAGWSPADIDLIECHATGTPVGDGVEIESLQELWRGMTPPSNACVLGGVKSNVGHLLTGAGAAGLMKVLLALQAETLPPTANFTQPAAGLARAESPFRVLSRAEHWPRRDAAIPRRAAINAFGFGGINAHLLIEEWSPGSNQQAGTTPAVLPTIPATPHDPIAVVGVAVRLGNSTGADEDPRQLITGRWPDAELRPAWWGAEETSWFDREYGGAAVRFAGVRREMALPFGEFRIPPVEIAAMLPQQQLMLRAAADALTDAGLRKPGEWTALGNRAGVFIGLELDLNTTNFHVRWALEEALAGHDPEQEALRQQVSPPLTADRVMGNLGGIVASRLAREFDVGGPCFTTSSGETSGLSALKLAVDQLTRGELDVALVGAIDLPSDLRATLAEIDLGQSRPIADGAVALVLKRQSAAVRDGNQIVALIEDLQGGRTPGERLREVPAPVDPASATSSPATLPHWGAATGLIGLTRAMVALASGVRLTPTPQFWFRDAALAPRRIDWHESGRDGLTWSIALREPSPPSETSSTAIRRRGTTLIDRGLAATLFAFSADSPRALIEQLRHCEQQLIEHAASDHPTRWISAAATWAQQRPRQGNSRWAIVATDLSDFQQQLATAVSSLSTMNPTASSITGPVAFVFPGSGNHFLGMGRELLTAFPEVLEQQERENATLAQQYRPELIWNGPSTAAIGDDHKAMIFGQVALGTALCDLLERFHVRPRASIGYSLGESAALFGLRAWRDRDEMLARMERSPLFGSDLVSTFDAARVAWHLPAGTSVPWLSGVVDRGPDEVRAALAGFDRAWLLIVNTPRQCVIGGEREQVQQFVTRLQATFIPLSAPSTVHCPIVRVVEQPYRALHDMRTTPPADVQFYSTAWGRAYPLTQQTAADAIVAQAVDTIDFPQVIRQAYADGIRQFVEIGPGNSCSRMIAEILADQPHYAGAVCPITADAGTAFLRILSDLHRNGVDVDERFLFGGNATTGSTPASAPRRQISTTIGGASLRLASSSTSPLKTDSSPVPPPTTTVQTAPAVAVAENITDQFDVPPSLMSAAPSALNGDHHHGIDDDSILVESAFNVLSPLNANDSPDWFAATPSGFEVDTVFSSGWESPAFPSLIPDNEPSFMTTAPALNPGNGSSDLLQQFSQMLASGAAAHAAYLQLADRSQQLLVRMALQGVTETSELAELPASMPVATARAAAPAVTVEPPTPTIFSEHIPAAPNFWATNGHAPHSPTPTPIAAPPQPTRETPPRSLTREECMQFAIGRIGDVLGTQFAAIDAHPTRVRLPDEPLMLVDRILAIEGEPLSMTSGRVITEHDIHPGAWYLDQQRIPTCIAVEAGQADLFLSGWLGIDLQTKGHAVYRLLDAVVTFHQGLPGPGKTIHYDIRVNQFFRQGETYLFRFEFDATVEGQPLLTMREGCAGFFTEAELAGGKGIVHTALDRQPRPGKRPADWTEFVPLAVESYSDAQLDRLRLGDLAGCFGPQFAQLPITAPVTIPGAGQLTTAGGPHDQSGTNSSSTDHTTPRMRLVDRILQLDPTGGKYGLGQIRGEADIHPDDWFLTCHFCDDQVMPGTLMYECCLHTLRIYLLRMGWIGSEGTVAYEPVPGVRSRLKCRGQVLASTQRVWYEITLKELGYGHPGDPASDAPYCLADALMYADGKPIVEITDMSVRLTGLTRAGLEALWHDAAATASTSVSNPVITQPTAVLAPRYDRRPALFDTARIRAFAIGKPSDAFGDRYTVFDDDRVIARLPGPPFQFLDRITSITNCEPWKMQAGGEIVAQYDVPVDEWYFAANRQSTMPFSVLLETALQPCGWLAAYVGSALTSEDDLSFRNLGGQATQFLPVPPTAGTLTTTVKLTKVANSGGMIIQHYDFDLRCDDQPLYVGNTYFGFFSKTALANQVGIRDAQRYQFTAEELARASAFKYPTEAPFPTDAMRMVDQITEWVPDGGPAGLGAIRGTMTVDPDAWFFRAHFYQDPVVPGSLGLESFLQLLKVVAARRWSLDSTTEFAAVALGAPHKWIYRGQVLPTDKLVTVEAVVKAVDDATHTLRADGYLSVDGRTIYQMLDFTIQADRG